MKALAAAGNYQFELTDRAARELEAHEVRVAITACGLCGSDLHAFRTGMKPGHVPGHEIAGVVSEVGAKPGDITVGASVVVEPIMSCGECEACLQGREMQCRRAQLFGVHLPGGMASEIVVPAKRVFPLDPTLPPSIAALTEPVAVALHALSRGSFRSDQRVLVLGAGAIGLICVFAAKAMGAHDVWATARYEHQAALAKEMGAQRVLDAADADANALARLGQTDDIDLVIETVGGTADTLNLACAALRPGGHASILGLFGEPAALDVMPALAKELTLSFSNCYHRPVGERPDFERAARLVENERERLGVLCTHQFPLDRAREAFDLAGQKSKGAVKVTVCPSLE